MFVPLSYYVGLKERMPLYDILMDLLTQRLFGVSVAQDSAKPNKTRISALNSKSNSQGLAITVKQHRQY